MSRSSEPPALVASARASYVSCCGENGAYSMRSDHRTQTGTPLDVIARSCRSTVQPGAGICVSLAGRALRLIVLLVLAAHG